MPGLRDILDAATPPLLTVAELDERIAQARGNLDNRAAYDIEVVVQADKDKRRYEYLRRYAVELEDRTALCLGMGEALRTMAYWDVTTEHMRCPLCESAEDDHDAGCPIPALLARLDRIGKEPS